MTATATRNSECMATWAKVFPRQVAENYTHSVIFMKQLTVIAVSVITYIKDMFPQENYTSETFEGIHLTILKKTCKDENAQFLSTAMLKAFDALDKKYLHQLAVSFYENERKAENLIEFYTFEYSYNDDSMTMRVTSKNGGKEDNLVNSSQFSFEEIRKRTIKMIRSCCMLANANLNNTVQAYDISLQLYYNEDAPASYQAPGFTPLTTEAEDDLKALQFCKAPMGLVETPFHKVVCNAYIGDVNANCEPIPSGDNVMNVSSFAATSESESEIRVRCACKKYDGEDLLKASETLLCQYCNTLQHAVCYGVLHKDACNIQHCCDECYDEDNRRKPTDMKLVSLRGNQRRSYAITRRTLAYCPNITAINTKMLIERMHFSKEDALKIMKMVYNHRIVRDDPAIDASCQNIAIDELRATMFNTKEPFMSQDSLKELMTEVLSSLQKVSHQLSEAARVADKPQDSDDPMLQQNRDALKITDNVEELEANFVESVKISVKRKSTESKYLLRTRLRTKKAKVLPK